MIVLLNTQNAEIKKRISKLVFPDLNVVNVSNEKYLKHYIEEYLPDYVIVSNTISNIDKITEFIINMTSSRLIITEDRKEKTLKKDPGCIYVRGLSSEDDIEKIFHIITSIEKGHKETSASSNSYLKQEVISVYSAQGGCGKTTLSFNLAWTLRNAKALKTLVIDLNFQEGPTDLAVNLNSDSFPNLFNFMKESPYESGSLKKSVIRLKNTNIDILFPPPSIRQSDKISIDLLTELVYEARNNYNFIIADLPFCYSNINLEMLALSTTAISVSSPEIPSSLRLKSMNKYLNEDLRKIHIINNLRDSDLRIIPQLESILEKKIFSVIPFIGKKDRNYLKAGLATYNVLDFQNHLNNTMDLFN